MIPADIDKAALLAALYNHAKPAGFAGALHHDPAPMTREQALALLERGRFIDYVSGRPLKVDLFDPEEDGRLYDRDQGEGSFARIVAAVVGGAPNAATSWPKDAARKYLLQTASDHEESCLEDEGRDLRTAAEEGEGDTEEGFRAAFKRICWWEVEDVDEAVAEVRAGIGGVP
jgi:hypothetical protein